MAPPYQLAYTIPRNNQNTAFQATRYAELDLDLGEFEFLGLTLASDVVVDLGTHFRRTLGVNPTADFLANYPTDADKEAALAHLFDSRISVGLCTAITLSTVTL